MSKEVQLNLGTNVEPEDLEVAELLFELKKFELEAKTNCLYLDWDKIGRLSVKLKQKMSILKQEKNLQKSKGDWNPSTRNMRACICTRKCSE